METIETVRIFIQHPDKSGKFLFVQNTERKKYEPDRLRWTLPGGQIEPGEGANDAASRELIEEAGVEIGPREFCLCGQKYFLKKSDGIIIAIQPIAVQSYTDSIIYGDEVQNHIWTKISERPSLLTAGCRYMMA